MKPVRLLADPYDNAVQCQHIDWGREDNFEVYLGRLRLDALLYDAVIFKDGDVFGGHLFLEAARLDRLPDLPWGQIEVRSRASTIGDAIFQAIKQPGAAKLVPTFAVQLPSRYAARLGEFSEKLGDRDAGDVQTFDDFGTALTDVGVAPDDADTLIHRWHAIERFMQDKRLEPWGDNGWPFDTLIAQQQGSVGNWMKSDLGKAVFADVSQVLKSRNLVYRRLLQAEGTDDSEARKDLQTIRTWYNFAYKRAQAHQHQCNAVEVSVEPGCRQFGDLDLAVLITQLANNAKIQIPETFLTGLARLPKSEFDGIRIDANGPVMRGILEWRALSAGGRYDDARSSLARGIEALVEKLRDMPTYLTATAVDYAAALSAGAAVAVSGEALASRFSRRRLFWVGAGAVVSGAVALLPFKASRYVGVEDFVSDVAQAVVRHTYNQLAPIP